MFIICLSLLKCNPHQSRDYHLSVKYIHIHTHTHCLEQCLAHSRYLINKYQNELRPSFNLLVYMYAKECETGSSDVTLNRPTFIPTYKL